MATVTTDKLDYAPGETTTITADGFTAGSTIEFHVEHIGPGPDGLWGTDDDSDYSQTGSGHEPWYVTDGGVGDLDGVENGVIQTTWFVNPDDSLDETFLLTATGDGVDGTFATADDEVATATFTDTLVPSNNIDSLNAWDPNFSGGGWSASGANDFYAEKDVVPFRIALKDVTEGVVYTVVFGLDLNLDVTGALGFSDTALFDTTVTPTLGIGGSLSTATSHNFQATNVGSIGSDFLGFYTSKTNVTLSDGESVSLSPGYQWWEVNFTPDDGDGDVSEIIDLNVVVGGILAGFGDTIKSAGDPAYKFYTTIPSTVPIDLGASQVGGTFQAVLGGVASKTVNFKGSDIVIPPDILITKEIDRDGNGVFESTANINEYSFTIYLDDGDGITEISEGGHDTLTFTQTLNTDASGQVLFVDVEDGTYWITENQENFDVGTYTFAEGVIVDSGLPQGFVGEIAQVTVAGGSSGSGGPQEAEVIYRNEQSQGTVGLSYKFEDVNGNGIWNDGEGKLANWEIRAYADDGDGILEQTEFEDGAEIVFTGDGGIFDPLGLYTMTLDAGDYVLVEVLESGWTPTQVNNPDPDPDQTEVLHVDLNTGATTLSPYGYGITVVGGAELNNLNFGNFEQFDISGTKYTDDNGDGDTTGDIGLAGVTIFIDNNDDGVLDSGDTQTTTIADGTWSFTNLDFNDDGKTVYEVLPSGYVQTLGTAGYDIVGTSGNDQTGLDFANFELFDISGTKYTDTNGDGLTDGDSGLVGVTIFIDNNDDGVLDSGDTQTTTIADGTWSFTNLDFNDDGKTVYEVLPSGYVQTLGTAGYDIVGTSGNDQTGLDFANFELFDISGTKYTDTNGDGLTDGDSGLVGVTIFIDNNDDGVLDSGDTQTTTIADGTWSFTNLDFNDDGKTVYEVLPSGYVQTLGTAGYDIVGTSGNDQTGLDFANFELFDISGTKYTDDNGDGDTTGDIGLAGVTIFIDNNDDGVLDSGDTQTTTIADGTWSFTNLDFNDDGKTVYEVLPSGYVQTLGTAGYDIVGTSGNDQTGLDFANFELFDISGTKYTDTNGDGLTDGDSGLVGVTIFIDNNDDGVLDSGDTQTTTIADGTWSFTNLDFNDDGKTVYEVLPSGYVQTLGTAGYDIVGTSGNDQTGLDFANFELFDISGTKYTDTNGDGLTDGDSGLVGVTIFIDNNDDGVLDSGDTQTTTIADGTWSFTNLDFNDDGKTVYEVLPSGYVQTLGTAGYDIVGTSGNDQTGLDFANFELFDISGTKYTDTNGDGLTDGDSGLVGVTIFIDNNDDGVLDSGDTQTTTIADGTWSFTNLDFNDDGKTVYEVLPSGYVQTLGTAGYDIVGTSGNDQTGLDFANFELFDISGTKYTDTNGDGLTDGDSGLVGVTIFIDNNDDGVLDSGDTQTTTIADGTWSFTNLDFNDDGKTVYEVLPSGYVQTLGTAGYDIVGTSGNDQTGLDFANFELFDISGTKYTDTNGDGLTDGDSGLVGVTIFIDNNDDGVLDSGDTQTTTIADGTWSFTNLDFNDDGKTVYEVLPSGYVQTLGTAGYDIVGTSGNDQTGLDFANFELFDISGTKYTDTNGDGLTDGDSGLVGVTIFIDNNDDGVLDSGDTQTTTIADGTWSFTNLDFNDDGKTVYEVLPSGYVQTLGTAGYDIVGTSGNDQTGLDFANFELFDISGTKYTDTNGDGLTDGDSGLVGVTIFIDNNDDGVLDSGDTQTTTIADGTWSFTNLDFNDDGKTVYEVLPSGYVQTLGTAGYDIVGTSGNDQTGLDFANFELFDISGTKYTDTNGDGLTDGDSGLVGVTIFIDNNDDGVLDSGDTQTTTIADGTWSFTNLDFNDDGKTVYEVLPSGYVQTLGTAGYDIVGTSGNDQTGLDFANFELFDISGTKYTDTNGDGLTDGDSGLVGVTIFIDNNDDGVLDSGDTQTTTIADGTWSFTNLDFNDDGKTVYEVLPSGYVQTLGTAGYDIVGTSGNDQTGLDFANFELFDISGTKYTDTNGDGLTDGDSGLVGVTIFIDNNDDGVLDSGDTQTTTIADGTWSFTNLDFNDDGKTVYEVLPSGYVQTLGTAGYDIVGTSGNDQTGLDFANFELFDISGTKYTDTNGDGLTDGDSGLVGVTIFIDNNDDGVLDSGDTQTTTIADGTWSFTNLDFNDDGKTVYEVLPSGYVQTLGTAGYDIVGASGNDQTGLDFANFEQFDISGYKWNDADADGVWDEGEAVIAGWTIYLDEDGDGISDQTLLTNDEGKYTFADLGPGTYAISEDLNGPDGNWVNTYNGSTTIDGQSGADQSGTLGTAEALNFGNWTQEGQPSIEVNVLSAEWEAPSPDDNLKHVTGEVLITDESEGGSIPDGFLIAMNEFEVSLTSKEGRGKAQDVEGVIMYEIVSIDGDVTRAGEGYTPGVDPLIFDESLVLRYIAWADVDIFNNEDINGDLNVTAEAGIHFRTNKNFLDRESFAENELNAALTLDGDPIKHSLAPDLDEADLQSVVDTVIGYLAELGADADTLEKLEDADLQIKDLSAINDGKTLSYWDGSVITFDDDAAGYGWSDDIGNVNPDQVDLLSSVVHEFGHVLGYDHDVLDPDLAVGERDLPGIEAENVNAWTAGILDEQVDMVGVQDAQIVELVG